MEVRAKLSNLRTAPRKVRLVADLVRGKTLAQARQALSFTTNKSARNVLKLLNSAAASAKHNFQLEEAKLFVSKIMVDEGPKLKRWHPMSRGRAYPIMKRTSHIVLTLSEAAPTIKATTKTLKTKTSNTKSQTKPKKRISKLKTKKI